MMTKIKYGKKGFLPQFTLGKMIRLAAFIILTAVGVTLSRSGHINTFLWGYFLGLIGMAILIG